MVVRTGEKIENKERIANKLKPIHKLGIILVVTGICLIK